MINNSLILHICRHSIALVWLYQGLIPKLLGPHHDEIAMGRALGISAEAATALAYIGGGLEMLLGVLVMVFYQRAWPFLLTILAMVSLWVFTALYAPWFMQAAFNPTTANLAVAALAMIALVCLKHNLKA
ncbi:DoxX-like family protein [Methylovulum psychrotolerans]|uniref:DoxX-like family protein n=1 Tax=Methylovulum psychrotolerans TaxID=1704499 RepID=UPI001BFFC075|nr:DoxX-like family protein [Methylovulum psychrotolerans]MBT9099618.1 DoxX-like family protein [Methylovulum psychrotolerans]